MNAPVDTAVSQDEARIRELLAEQESAMRAKDPERLVAQYAPEIVRCDLAPPLRTAGAEVLDPRGMREWFATFDGPLEFDITDLSVAAGAEVAYCHGLYRLSAKPQGEPEKFELWFRGTVCLRKIDGAWKITHEHTSTPFYMDGSFRAAVDLKP
ncbi:YybH family protein [Amycolatopsis anabasis]|uniref:YybH family protein n=1 Tax=Amycolatopsis anabasis TaxID=1840409 RepID=UPI001FED00B0|nr:nuclear transport factor 2 family protein [Amycolatopsis anabasis]